MLGRDDCCAGGAAGVYGRGDGGVVYESPACMGVAAGSDVCEGYSLYERIASALAHTSARRYRYRISSESPS